MKNVELTEYLNNFISPKNKYDFAILISGDWGSGKSHFIENYIEDLKTKHSPPRILRATFNGVSKIQQIEDQFFEQVHPFLADKNVKIIGSILKASVKIGLKYDFNGDKSDDLTLSPSLGSLITKESEKLENGSLIVFDDIERAKMTLAEIFGYINNLVELQKLKVVMIANEGELIENKETQNTESAINRKTTVYMKLKEKLVGFTFKIESDFDSAFASFLSNLNSDEAKKILNENKEKIKNVFIKSGKSNLRALKQIIWEFERVSLSFSEDTWSSTEHLNNFLLIFFAVGLEYKIGNINSKEDILKIGDSSTSDFSFLNQVENSSKSIIQEIEDKYVELGLPNSKINGEILAQVIFDGKNGCEIDKAINKISVREIESWEILWNYFETDDSCLKNAYDDVEQKLSEYYYKNIHMIMHLFGIYLRLSKLGFIRIKTNSLVRKFTSYVSKILEKDLLYLGDQSLVNFSVEESFAGYGFLERDTEEFKNFEDFIRDKRKLKIEKKLELEAIELSKKISGNAFEFMTLIAKTVYGESKYYALPIMKYVKPDKIFSLVEKLTAEGQINFARAMHIRYEYRSLKYELFSEKEWLIELKDTFDIRIEKVKSKISKARLRSLYTQYIKSIQTEFIEAT